MATKPIENFLHLTGMASKTSAKDFYKNAKDSKLMIQQFYFDARHVYANAKKKLPCLIRLPELTTETLQFFLGRSADIDDMLLNIAGTIVGFYSTLCNIKVS